MITKKFNLRTRKQAKELFDFLRYLMIPNTAMSLYKNTITIADCRESKQEEKPQKIGNLR